MRKQIQNTKSRNSLFASGYSLVARTGAVTLPAVLMISAIIMEVALVAVIISSTLVSSTNREKLSSESIKAAQAGIQDATIRVVRYCSLANDSSHCPGFYSIDIGSRTVDVTIDDRVTVEDNFTRIITATGRADLVRKKLEALLNINGETGEVGTQYVKEIPL